MMACPNCKGDGKVVGPKYAPFSNWDWKECPTCNGIGKVANRFRGSVVCRKCEGWGQEPPRVTGFTCRACSGWGVCIGKEAGTSK